MVLLYIPLHDSMLWCIIHYPILYHSMAKIMPRNIILHFPPIQSTVHRLAGLVLPGSVLDIQTPAHATVNNLCPCTGYQP